MWDLLGFVWTRDDYFCFSRRLHSEGQSSSVCNPYLDVATHHKPQGEERHRDPVLFHFLWRSLKQRQVIKLSDINIVMVWLVALGSDGCTCSCLCNSRLSESPETESETLKVNSRSEELLQTPVSSSSTNSSFGEGMSLTGCLCALWCYL